jgi:ribonucleoside-diphosphate reductase beta chain
MAITDKRIAFKPFEYQWAYDYWFQQQNAHWLHTEINMQKDIKDWKEELDENEKAVIGEILKGFAQTETAVEDYWSGYIPKWFPKPEIKMMAVTFGAFETIHATAYSYLNDILGLDDFEAFMDDPATMERLDQLINIPDDADAKSKLLSLALFSAFAEGVSLFSQFAILLSFRKKNLLTGIGQQMIFSCRDESLHSEAGCKLFREYLSDLQLASVDLIDLAYSVRNGAKLFLQKEYDYIDSIFKNGDLDTITRAQIKNFLNDRANRKLAELGYAGLEKFEVDEELLKEMDWFYIMVSGEQQTDFFFNRETGYSKPNEDWNDDDIF